MSYVLRPSTRSNGLPIVVHDLVQVLVEERDRPAAEAERPSSSSPGPPGACTTPSSVMKVVTISLRIDVVRSPRRPARTGPLRGVTPRQGGTHRWATA
jgi:hypothetical protein